MFALGTYLDIRAVPMGDKSTLKLQLQGDLDRCTGSLLRARIRPLLKGGWRNICLDLSSVNHLDGLGISTLVEVHEKCRAARGRAVITKATPYVDALLRARGLQFLISQAPGLPGDRS